MAKRHDVGLHAQLFIGKQRPRSPHSCLDFVENQENILLRAELPQILQIGLIGDMHASLTLDRLQHDRGRLVRHERFDRRKIVEGRIDKPRNERLKAFLHFFLAGRRQRRHRAAVERVLHRDDLEPVRTVLLMPVAPRQLDRRFVRLRAAVAEKDPVGARMIDQHLGESDLRLGVVEIRHMDQLRRLALDRLHQIRMAVAQDIDRDATDKVDVLPAFHVVDLGPTPPHD